MRKLVLLILSIVPIFIVGQIYDSQRLSQIGTMLQLSEHMLPGDMDTCLFLDINNHPIRVEIDSCEVVTHIGCRIFPDSIQLHTNPLVQQFIERYILEALLHKTKYISLQKKMKSDNVRFYAGTWQNLLHLNWADTTLNTSLSEDDVSYRLYVQLNQKTICDFSFPKDYQLLAGKDKLELDEQLFHPCKTPASELIAPDINPLFVRAMPFASYEIAEGDYFYTPQLSNTMYVQKKGNSYNLLFAPYLYPEQTIANVMLCGNERAYNMVMTHHRYGYNTITDTIPLNTWINLARDAGCVPYWGVQKNNGEFIEGTYVWINNTFGYLHVLFVRFPVRTLYIPTIPIKCTLHSYVRVSNVASLFAEKNIHYTK